MLALFILLCWTMSISLIMGYLVHREQDLCLDARYCSHACDQVRQTSLSSLPDVDTTGFDPNDECRAAGVQFGYLHLNNFFFGLSTDPIDVPSTLVDAF